MFIRFYNTGILPTGIPKIGSGWRALFVQERRKYALVLDWVTGDTAKVCKTLLRGAQTDLPRKLVVTRCIARISAGRKRTEIERAACSRKQPATIGAA